MSTTFSIATIPADGVGKEVVASGRAVLDALAALLNITVAGPCPDAAPITTSHSTLLVAVQAQLAGVETLTTAVPPAAGRVCDAGPTV